MTIANTRIPGTTSLTKDIETPPRLLGAGYLIVVRGASVGRGRQGVASKFRRTPNAATAPPRFCSSRLTSRRLGGHVRVGCSRLAVHDGQGECCSFQRVLCGEQRGELRRSQ